MRILVVDDHRNTLIAMSIGLRRAGHSAAVAGGADEALAALDGDHFDCVVCDVRMPSVGGLELAQSIRRRRPSLPIVLMTAFDLSAAESALAGEIGAPCLLKPVGVDACSRRSPQARVEEAAVAIAARAAVATAVSGLPVRSAGASGSAGAEEIDRQRLIAFHSRLEEDSHEAAGSGVRRGAGPDDLARVGATGVLVGTVTDASKAVLPGVTVTVSNQNTGLKQVVVTTEDGEYRVRALPLGTYSIEAELSGFAPVTRKDVAVGLESQVRVDLVLEVGGVQESVTVLGEVPLVDTQNSEVGGNVTAEAIKVLPVAGRQWINLATLMPGTGQDAIRAKYYNSVNIGAGITFYSNGFYVDGVTNNWQQQGEPRQDFPQDAIAEFRVHSFNAPTTYGFAQGGYLSTVTKSGTNQFHGDAFWFYRNKALNAKTVFQTTNPDYQRNQVGGAFGGPIVRDRAQFFVADEYTDENRVLHREHARDLSGRRRARTRLRHGTTCWSVATTRRSTTSTVSSRDMPTSATCFSRPSRAASSPRAAARTSARRGTRSWSARPGCRRRTG